MTELKSISKGRLWTGRIMSAIAILFMLMDSIIKFFQPPTVVETTVSLGFSEHHIVTLGVLEMSINSEPPYIPV